MIGVLLFTAVIVIFLIRYYYSISKLPPGPWPLPFIGNLGTQIIPPFVFRDLRRLASKYRGVMTVHMPFPVINISDFETLKQVMRERGDDFSGRIQTLFPISHTPNGGILTSNGDNWREQRRTTIGILRDFGMGRNIMEEKVTMSAMEYLRCLKDKKNLDRIDMRWTIQLFVANIINEIVFGYRYPYDDCEQLINFVNNVYDMIDVVSKSKLFLLVGRFPWMKSVPILKYYGYEKHVAMIEKLKVVVRAEVAKAEATYNEDDEPSCFVHAYMKKMKDNENLTRLNLTSCCQELFLAGQETATTTLRWTMLFMAAHQDVQDRVREEIFSVVGKERIPSMIDKGRMPYTSATLHEIQRRANILPTNPVLFRKTTTDTHIGEYQIPEGTMINMDLHQIHSRDPIFIDPERFNPDRYLCEDGVTLRKDLIERTIPFGIGKRQCAGEGLARVELFFGLTATLQNYRVLPPVDGTPVDLTPICLNILLPKPHELQLVPV